MQTARHVTKCWAGNGLAAEALPLRWQGKCWAAQQHVQHYGTLQGRVLRFKVAGCVSIYDLLSGHHFEGCTCKAALAQFRPLDQDLGRAKPLGAFLADHGCMSMAVVLIALLTFTGKVTRRCILDTFASMHDAATLTLQHTCVKQRYRRCLPSDDPLGLRHRPR